MFKQILPTGVIKNIQCVEYSEENMHANNWNLQWFSIIAQVIIEKRTLWLVEDYIISCYNHPTQGDYNAEAPIFKMVNVRFLMFLEKREKKMH